MSTRISAAILLLTALAMPALAKVFSINFGRFECLGTWFTKDQVSSQLVIFDNNIIASNAPQTYATNLGEGWSSESVLYKVDGMKRPTVVPCQAWKANDSTLHCYWNKVSLLEEADNKWIPCPGEQGR